MINWNYISYMNYLGIMKDGNHTRHTDNARGYGKHFIRGSDSSEECQRNSQIRYPRKSGGGT